MRKDCKIHDCKKRHPKICIFKSKFGQCKCTTYCKYEHDKASDTFENSDKDLELEKKIEHLQPNLKTTDINILNKEVDNKIETLENKMKILVHLLEEKDLTIGKLEKKQEEVEDKFEKRNKDLEDLIKKEQENLES